MFCAECGHQLPDLRDDSTICSNCRTPLATWWDEPNQTFRTNRELLLPYDTILPNAHREALGMSKRKNTQTIEERCFQAALISLEGHFENLPGFGSRIMPRVKKLLNNTVEMSLNKVEIRETLSKNVDIWMRLQKIFNLAVPTLASRSLRESYAENGVPNGLDIPESAHLILKNSASIIEDMQYLNSLLVISRNMLALKDTAQEICAAVQFDKPVQKLIILCVNVTSKGYDGENVDDQSRIKLNEVTELYKKLLVICLQHTHNWIMGNDRFKMSFWFEMLFDSDLHNDNVSELAPDDLNVENVHDQVKNWLRRYSTRDKLAMEILDKYTADVETGFTPGPLPESQIHPPKGARQDEGAPHVWNLELTDKYERDRIYARVSHEVDCWWKRVRDANYEGWVVAMESVENAIARAEAGKQSEMDRFTLREHEHNYQHDDRELDLHDGLHHEYDDSASNDAVNGYDDEEDEDDEDDDEDDDDSCVEGPLRGLLTEIPNILDTKQIEALHMTVKACIVDSMGSGLTPAGENLQKTRCKMFLALDCGKNLLREMLVFIAVWEQTDQQFIFQITAQIIESFHHNALLPYAWNSLRIMKDIVSPAQTILLRLINYMFRARKDSPIYDDLRDYSRDAKLIHFLYNYFRCRVVPDCISLIHAQAQIRRNKCDPGDFPVDLWDMERAKDGLSQYLDFLSVIAEIPKMRPLLIEWEAVYELIALLQALEAGVSRKELVSSQPRPAAGQFSSPTAPLVERPYETNQGFSNPQSTNMQPELNHHPNLPPLHDTPHKFPWAGIKVQILIILTSLVAPPNIRRSGAGNPIVQKQILARGGIMPLLNCCAYDGHNEYLKERATLAIKFLMEGCEEAQKFVSDLVPKQAQTQAKAQTMNQARGGDAVKANIPSFSTLPQGAGPGTASLPSRPKDDLKQAGESNTSAASATKFSQQQQQHLEEARRMHAEGKDMIAEARALARKAGASV